MHERACGIRFQNLNTGSIVNKCDQRVVTSKLVKYDYFLEGEESGGKKDINHKRRLYSTGITLSDHSKLSSLYVPFQRERAYHVIRIV